jgi:hypothetical protein
LWEDGKLQAAPELAVEVLGQCQHSARPRIQTQTVLAARMNTGLYSS